ncbi:MAG: Crp/Fnr family transcriptional regulator [candidate division Zixibacteria bacterium]|nr:Crp/Fnr family transcriptional regulator [candidate division Zixibacteria bacterium]
MNTIQYLNKSTLFAGLDSDELRSLSDTIAIKRLKKGEILFLDGDVASGFYAVFEGKIRIFKSNPDGKEYTIHVINPGQIFGEVAIFEGTNFPASSIAIENSVVGFFPKDRFLALIKEYPNISLKIIGSLARFLREYNRMVEDLALKEVPARIAGYLLAKAGETNKKVINLDIKKTELALKLGTISETLSRNLRKMKDNGIIKVDNQQIDILDFNRLNSIADGEKF